MNQPDAQFKALPIAAARQVGFQYHKDQVVILSFDDSCGMLSMSTWGRSEEDKQIAARVGGSLVELANGRKATDVFPESFREIESEVEQLAGLCQKLQSKLSEAVYQLSSSYADLIGRKWASDVKASGLLNPIDGGAQ